MSLNIQMKQIYRKFWDSCDYQDCEARNKKKTLGSRILHKNNLVKILMVKIQSLNTEKVEFEYEIDTMSERFAGNFGKSGVRFTGKINTCPFKKFSEGRMLLIGTLMGKQACSCR